MTRYPKDGKGSKWTSKELDSIPLEWRGDTLSDGGGLSGTVRVNAQNNISIRFQYVFRIGNKTSFFQCGSYPTLSISAIRKNRDIAKTLVAEGVDPRIKKAADKIKARNELDEIIQADIRKQAESLTFNDLYEVWIKDGVARSDGNKYIIQSFTKHALPSLKSIEIRILGEDDLRQLYRKIIASGKVATAVELSKDIGQMLRWAEMRKPWRPLLIEGNPSELVEIEKLLPKDYTKERTRFLSVDEIKKLKEVFDESEKKYDEAKHKYDAERPLKKEVQIAMWLCLSTLCRIGELLMTEWKHVNFLERTWFIPSANVKGERGRKKDQIVYLSDFSLNQFQELYSLTGDGRWAFPARYTNNHVCIKSASKLVGDRQTKFKKRTKKLKYRVENDSLVLGEQEWTPHDLRRTGATMMQKLKISRDVINLCQNHVIGTKVDRVYLLDDYADDKRAAWDKLGKWIEAIIAPKDMTPKGAL